ncbi:MAG: SDR family NAD(P)-dependent oxidoreductase [Pigmentiphaga sp.]
MHDFSRHVVLITGAAGNLGKALSDAFAHTGAHLILLDRVQPPSTDSQGDDTARRITLGVDLLYRTKLEAALSEASARLGAITIVCNTVGGFQMGDAVHATDSTTWDSMLDLNVRSMLNVCSLLVPSMIEQGGGKIINVAAAAARQGQALMGAYCAAKSAVASLTESMSAELKDKGINVNCVLPSIIDTPQNRAAMPDGRVERWVAPADLARVMLFLASDEAIAIHGARIPVYGRG